MVQLFIRGKVKHQIKWTEWLSRIMKMDKLSEWCSVMVPIPKQISRVYALGDLTRLNAAVFMEKPTVQM